ncbi:MAG: ribbon-helix-helix protein, CopG family [Sulfurovaceae bacterium]|nr:ribbon-helix-helix protein, CopG family [Sulfurovaceae bacterium]
MVATVRLDDVLEDKLNALAHSLHKKKSDVIREAIEYYAKSIEKSKKSRILKAVEKTKNADKDEYINLEGTLSDGL